MEIATGRTIQTQEMQSQSRSHCQLHVSAARTPSGAGGMSASDWRRELDNRAGVCRADSPPWPALPWARRAGGTVSRPISAASSRVEARAGRGPVLGGELQVAIPGPVGEHPEDIAQVALGVEPVQARRGDEREQVPGAGGMLVAAYEQPALATDGESPFILPMSARSPSCTTDGTRSSARRSGSRIASTVEAKT